MFRNMTKAFFKETADGKTIYYANGVLRQGYIIENEEKKKKIYKYHKRVFSYILPLGILYALLWGLMGVSWEGSIPVIIVVFMLTYQKKKLIKGLSVYEETLSPNEVKSRAMSAFPMWFVVLMMVNGSLASLFGVFLFFVDISGIEDTKTIALVLLTMGLPLLGLGSYMYKNKR